MSDDVVAPTVRFTEEELIEFLEGDLLPDTADPEFKAKLREQLRAFVVARRRGRSGPVPGGGSPGPAGGSPSPG